MDYSAFDIIGPRMIGPSSSHTAGAGRIGMVAGKIARFDVKEVEFILHGSFAKTYRGHGTDKALMAGVLGINEWDERLKDSLEIAKEKGIKYKFTEGDLGEVHPNTVKIIIGKSSGDKIEVVGSSIGGGNIKIIEINGLKVEFTGKYPTLITRHSDNPGIIAKVTRILADYNINIAYMRVFRYTKGEDAFMVIETDDVLSKDIEDEVLKIPGIKKASIIVI